MFRNFLKKLPFINVWHKNRRLTIDNALIESQLNLAVDEISRLKLNKTDARNEQNFGINEVVVSLTSYGQRVDSVHHTIISLLDQTATVNKLILWLSKEEFSMANLPQPLLELVSEYFEIQFCDDIKSYKKLIPTLELYPNAHIITFDDDVIYPHNHIEKLLETSEKFPGMVVCHLAHRIKAKRDAHNNEYISFFPYKDWHTGVSQDKPSYDLYPVGVGGVLYPPNSLDEEVLNRDAFTKLCPYADDIWFKLMATKKGTLTKIVECPLPYERYLHIPNTQHISLWQINASQNDIQFASALKAYPEIRVDFTRK